MVKTDNIRHSNRRTTSVWTREKITQLIKLYRKHDCLWNYYTEGYKSKNRRNKSIEDICKILNITKFDFGKKIHNLRNQFNSEMKKLERRIEEAGGNSEEVNGKTRCRWEHFEALLFLRKVIEPRPGGYQTSFPQPKKLHLKYDCKNEEDDEQHQNNNIADGNASATGTASDIGEFQFATDTTGPGNEESLEESNDTEEYRNYNDAVMSGDKEESFDQKYNPSCSTSAQAVTITLPVHNTKTYFTRIRNTQQKRNQIVSQQQQQEVVQLTDSHHTQNLSTGSVIELPVATSNTDQQTFMVCNPTSKKPEKDNPPRDQWDAFGELIATELRHLNSDMSRKKLKRKILQAMLEVGEEDDQLNDATN